MCNCPEGFRLDTSQGGAICIDKNECVEDETFCVDGYCKNNDGGATCDCHDGWVLDASGRQCIDQREGRCFDEYRRDICLAPRPGSLTRKSCCCTMGQAWGVGSDCQQCPEDGSKEFLKLCPGGMGRGEFGEDYNECEMMEDLCKNGRCINTDGSYR